MVSRGLVTHLTGEVPATIIRPEERVNVPDSKQLPFFVNLSLVNEDAPNQSCHVGEWYILTIPA